MYSSILIKPHHVIKQIAVRYLNRGLILSFGLMAVYFQVKLAKNKIKPEEI